MNNSRLQQAKNQTNAKQHSQAELLLFEDYSQSSSTSSSKNNRNAYTTFEPRFTKKLSNTDAELKKSGTYKKSVYIKSKTISVKWEVA